MIFMFVDSTLKMKLQPVTSCLWRRAELRRLRAAWFCKIFLRDGSRSCINRIPISRCLRNPCPGILPSPAKGKNELIFTINRFVYAIGTQVYQVLARHVRPEKYVYSYIVFAYAVAFIYPFVPIFHSQRQENKEKTNDQLVFCLHYRTQSALKHRALTNLRYLTVTRLVRIACLEIETCSTLRSYLQWQLYPQN